MKGPLERAVALADKKHDLVIGINWTKRSAPGEEGDRPRRVRSVAA